MRAHNKFKEIALFVAGSTPQIITETICAMALKSPPIMLDELFIITTTSGRGKIRNALMENGVLDSLVSEYGLSPLNITDNSFVVPRDNAGDELDDIKTAKENKLMGDVITSLIREKTADQRTRLHCSIAGGRKTMSFYMGSALQLFGRPWDKLYHVLVTAEFESNTSFFYKPKRNRTIECRLPDGTIKKLNTKDAEIHLAELPFIRLRDKLSLQGKGFKELVDEGQGDIDTASVQPEITVNLRERTVSVGVTLIEIVPMQLMLYCAFLRQKLEHCRFPDRPYCLDCTACFLTMADMSPRDFLERMACDYSRIYGKPLKEEELLSHWRDGMDMPAIRQNITKLNAAVKSQLKDPALLPVLLIDRIRLYGSTKYGIRAEKRKIIIE